MSSFFINSSLARGDLSLYLRNDSGLPQDGYDVSWTIFKKNGELSSGNHIPAIKANTGEYYAPWNCTHSGGCYEIKWEYKVDPNGAIFKRSQDFFLIDISEKRCCYHPRKLAPTDCGVYFYGQSLGPSDLHIKIIDDDGLPLTAFAVFWTIYDQCGRAITCKVPALPGDDLGEYYAPWTVRGSGECFILWEWMLDFDSALEAKRNPFTIIDSSCEIQEMLPHFRYGCPPICSSPIQIVIERFDSGIEIPRVVHLATQVLPVAGQFTNQSSYAIPHGIRKIAFYITYSRGAVGGFAVIRLMWGNGSEETQATIIDRSAAELDGEFSSQVMRLSDLMGPIPPDTSPISFMLEASVPGGSSTVRLLAAEGGVLGLPGTVSITLTASSD